MPSAQLRVLVVDDDELFAGALTAVLEAEGIEVVGHATNGAEALALAASTRPDIVTMDVLMPVMDGVEATRHLAAQGVPVVMLSESDEVADIAAAVAAGAVAGVNKREALNVLVPLLRAVTHRT